MSLMQNSSTETTLQKMRTFLKVRRQDTAGKVYLIKMAPGFIKATKTPVSLSEMLHNAKHTIHMHLPQFRFYGFVEKV